MGPSFVKADLLEKIHARKQFFLVGNHYGAPRGAPNFVKAEKYFRGKTAKSFSEKVGPMGGGTHGGPQGGPIQKKCSLGILLENLSQTPHFDVLALSTCKKLYCDSSGLNIIF